MGTSKGPTQTHTSSSSCVRHDGISGSNMVFNETFINMRNNKNAHKLLFRNSSLVHRNKQSQPPCQSASPSEFRLLCIFVGGNNNNNNSIKHSTNFRLSISKISHIFICLFSICHMIFLLLSFTVNEQINIWHLNESKMLVRELIRLLHSQWNSTNSKCH